MNEPIIVAGLIALIGTIAAAVIAVLAVRRNGNVNGSMMTLIQEQLARYDRREDAIRTVLAQNAETTQILREQQGTLQKVAEDLHRSVRAQEQLVERFDRHLFERRQTL